MLKELIHEKINEVFLECQEANGIISGDISPLDAEYLDRLEQELANHIARIIKYEIEMYKQGQLIAVNGGIYEYQKYDKVAKVHIVSEIDIDDEGNLTATHILDYLYPEQLAEGNNKIILTQEQWYGIVTHLLRQSCKYSEETIAEAAEDIVYRCFIINMPKFDELQDYIDCYMDR